MFDTNRFNPENTGFAGKMRPQANGGKKNTPSNLTLHGEAIDEYNLNHNPDLNPYMGPDGMWYWYDEGEQPSDPFKTRAEASEDLGKYIVYFNTPKEQL